MRSGVRVVGALAFLLAAWVIGRGSVTLGQSAETSPSQVDPGRRAVAIAVQGEDPRSCCLYRLWSDGTVERAFCGLDQPAVWKEVGAR